MFSLSLSQAEQFLPSAEKFSSSLALQMCGTLHPYPLPSFNVELGIHTYAALDRTSLPPLYAELGTHTPILCTP